MVNLISLGTPSVKTGNYQDYIDAGLNRSVEDSYPAFLGTKFGLTIYSTYRHPTAIEKRFYPEKDIILPNVGTIFSYDGKTIYNIGCKD